MNSPSNGISPKMKPVSSLSIPNSLRTIGPFLEEAQSIMRDTESGNQKVTIFCIDHALKLVGQFGLSIDEDAEKILKIFREKRDEIARELNFPELCNDAFTVFRTSGESPKAVSAEDILIAEGTATLELADQQYEEGMHQSAARNYHTATVYFRVLESMVPRLTSRVHESLNYAACRTHQSSHLLENLVHEHFEGLRCVDFYEIIENRRLGKGSYGSVYLCRHRKTGDEFACKVIGMNRINSHYLRKLHLEISIMKEVDHPNIIKLREVFFGSRTVYLIMGLCEGGELFDEITHNAQRGLGEAHAAKLMIDMLSAVRYLHQQGIAHRDLKLENFLFEQPGMHSPLKLIDFGLSKHFDCNESMHQVVGSAYYTAPEVLRGNYDYRCDVWSLGVIAYMLLSGAPPFNGDSSEKIHQLILNKEPDFSSKVFPNVQTSTIDFLKKLLLKDPNKRISIDEAFQHPFLQLATSELSTSKAEASLEVMNALGRFMNLSRFKKLMLEAVAFSLTPTQISILRTDFYAIDTDRSGTISLLELQEYVAKVSAENSFAASRVLLLAQETFQYDSSPEINYIDFLAAALCKRISIDEQRLVLAFEALDVDSKGYLDADAIRRAMGAGISDLEVSEMIAEVDSEHTGRINYIDFVKFWRNFILSQNVSPLQKFIRAVRKVSNGVTAVKIMKRLCAGATSSSSLISKCSSATSTSSTQSTGPGTVSPDRDNRYTFSGGPSRFFSRENSLTGTPSKNSGVGRNEGRREEEESEIDKENERERDRREKDTERGRDYFPVRMRSRSRSVTSLILNTPERQGMTGTQACTQAPRRSSMTSLGLGMGLGLAARLRPVEEKEGDGDEDDSSKMKTKMRILQGPKLETPKRIKKSFQNAVTEHTAIASSTCGSKNNSDKSNSRPSRGTSGNSSPRERSTKEVDVALFSAKVHSAVKALDNVHLGGEGNIDTLSSFIKDRSSRFADTYT